MMRYLNMDQEKIYQQYFQLGEEISKHSIAEKKLFNEIAWEIISKKGIWRFPIAKQYGGYGLGWQDCAAALIAFLNSYSNAKLISSLISQFSSLYLLSKYGTNSIKNKYLFRLTSGEKAIVNFSNESQSSSNQSTYTKVKKIEFMKKKQNKHPIFYTIEKKQRLLSEKIKFVVNKDRKLIMIDIINFERIIYGILASTHVLNILAL